MDSYVSTLHDLYSDLCCIADIYSGVPQIHPPPPFATLASVQNAGGGLYVGRNDFSRDYALLLVPLKHDLIVGGGWGPSARHR